MPQAPWVLLTTLRERSGLTMTDLARRAGMSVGHVNDLEKGRRRPTAPVRAKLATALNVPVVVLEPQREDVA